MPIESASPNLRQRLAIAACYASMFMLGISISLLGPSLPALAARTGIELSRAGIFFTLFAGGSVAATTLMARFNDRPIRHVLAIIGAAVMAASFALMATSRAFPQAALAAALSGMAMSTVGTAPNAIIADADRARAGQALNALHIAAGVGAFVGPLLIAAAIRLGSDYRAVYWLAAGLMVLVGLLWAAGRPPRPVRHTDAGAGLPGAALLPLFVLFLIAALYTGTESTLGGWLFTYARSVTVMRPETASLATSAFWLAILLGRLTAVRALRYLTNLRLLRVCVALAALGLGVILLAQTAPALLWLGVTMVGLGFGPVFPTTLALSGELAPRQAGAVASLVVSSGSVGAMILPWAAGALMPVIGIGGSIAGAWAPLAAMLACLVVISRALRLAAHPAR